MYLNYRSDMGKEDRYRGQYDPLTALLGAGKLMGMELTPCGENKLCGPYYLSGEPHQWRRDKLKVFISRGCVWVAEEGGRCISLPQWLIEFGHAADWKEAISIIRSGSGAFVWDGQKKHVTGAGETRYVDPAVLRGARAYDKELSPLFRWMYSMFPRERVAEVWDRYGVTTDFHGRTTFWYMDSIGRICHDKSIWYKEDGHRDKQKPMGRNYRVADGYSARCLFGAHLIPEEGEICCLESEKSVLLSALEYPDKIWVGAGGKSQLRGVNERFVLYPDLDAVEDWAGKGGRMEEWWLDWGLDPLSWPKNADFGDKIAWDHGK
jgi:hypothetical protein